ncbi:uncharacterized protein L3040_007987 [Drepanopeziza brunnea f. sp. 'multigermtubi']|uniref:uncharacterized protein n=1 Tax=Drepanopeziza brunnea f. sp. 'multigermtubi' TaxID=698441 RepID=UPI0023985198|nr:hypothetical protein L3040_007987 [Drepanopeziza brunnea f. sp. 'multigermtubi']
MIASDLDFRYCLEQQIDLLKTYRIAIVHSLRVGSASTPNISQNGESRFPSECFPGPSCRVCKTRANPLKIPITSIPGSCKSTNKIESRIPCIRKPRTEQCSLDPPPPKYRYRAIKSHMSKASKRGFNQSHPR